MTDKQHALTLSPIPWNMFTNTEIYEIIADATRHGDRVLAQKAKAALRRR